MKQDIGRPVVLFLDDDKIALHICNKFIEELAYRHQFDVITFDDDEPAYAFIKNNAERIFCFVQDCRRPTQLYKSIIPGFDWSMTVRGISVPWGAFSTYIADAYCPEAGQLFAPAGGSISEDGLIQKWSALDSRIYFHYKPLMKETLNQVILFQLKRWLIGTQKKTEIISDHLALQPVNEEMSILCASRSNYLEELSPRQLENVMADILKNNGLTTEVTAKTRDGGYDIIAISGSALKHETTLIEVKHFAPHRPVGVGIVRALYGVKTLLNADKAMLVTSSYVSNYAKKEFSRTIPLEIEFVEREKVLEWCTSYVRNVLLE